MLFRKWMGIVEWGWNKMCVNWVKWQWQGKVVLFFRVCSIHLTNFVRVFLKSDHQLKIKTHFILTECRWKFIMQCYIWYWTSSCIYKKVTLQWYIIGVVPIHGSTTQCSLLCTEFSRVNKNKTKWSVAAEKLFS